MSPLPIALSAGPLTEPCADAARRLLTARGWEVRVYQADGHGGRTLEADVLAGRIAAVLDLSLTELAAELLGLPGGAGPDRLTAAALRGVPQVIVLGELDAVQASGVALAPRGLPFQTNLGALTQPRSPVEFAGVTYLRTTPEENDRLGQEIANKASAARGPTAILIPRRGLSALDIVDGPFWWPAADAALMQSLRNWIGPGVQVRMIDLHIKDPAFAAAAVAALDEYIVFPDPNARGSAR
jgi:uncharacterized protein (UPF0261 family)